MKRKLEQVQADAESRDAIVQGLSRDAKLAKTQIKAAEDELTRIKGELEASNQEKRDLATQLEQTIKRSSGEIAQLKLEVTASN